MFQLSPVIINNFNFTGSSYNGYGIVIYASAEVSINKAYLKNGQYGLYSANSGAIVRAVDVYTTFNSAGIGILGSYFSGTNCYSKSDQYGFIINTSNVHLVECRAASTTYVGLLLAYQPEISATLLWTRVLLPIVVVGDSCSGKQELRAT